MRALIQDVPLTLDALVRRAEQLHPDKELVGPGVAGDRRRTYRDVIDRARRLAGFLDTLGVEDGARVATFGWNSLEHLEAYWAIPCSGRVLHTLNVRLFEDQLRYIVRHADDQVVIADRSVCDVLWPVLEAVSCVRHVVVIDDDGRGLPDPPTPNVEIHAYEAVIDGAQPREFRVVDEWQAAAMCYTSGTTGDPKGVVYGHRSSVLLALALLGADSFAVSERDVILPVVPMFHANCWGLVHAAMGAGSTLVLPGRDTGGPNLARLIETERVTLTAGVPTVWTTALPALREHDMSSLRMIISGGSAVATALADEYEATIGVTITQAWGMTETSPVGALNRITSQLDRTLDPVAKRALRASIGQIMLGMDSRVVDDDGVLVPWDGSSVGELQVRGPWVASAYYDDERATSAWTDDGWFRTGDVATIDPHGYVRLVDRLKDMVKSGGEWISSIDLECALVEHPEVDEAAVIGVPHEKWGERPYAYVVVRAGSGVTPTDLLEWLAPRIASWWRPDGLEIVDALPRTSVGKIAKTALREVYAAGH